MIDMLPRPRPEEPTPGAVLTNDTGEMTAPLRRVRAAGEGCVAQCGGNAHAHALEPIGLPVAHEPVARAGASSHADRHARAANARAAASARRSARRWRQRGRKAGVRCIRRCGGRASERAVGQHARQVFVRVRLRGGVHDAARQQQRRERRLCAQRHCRQRATHGARPCTTASKLRHVRCSPACRRARRALRGRQRACVGWRTHA
jgi:hypothetical protein